MAGLSALQSKLSKLNTISHPSKKQKVSVVFMNDDGTVDFPENCNKGGILLVPPIMTDEEWELQNILDAQ